MNAIKFLLKEHNKVRTMLTKLSKTSMRETTKKTLFNHLCKDLIIHETMEQKIWYPNFKKNKPLYSEVKHLISEENKAATAIKKLKKIKVMETWEEKFVKFKKDVEHHASEEETELFPVVEKYLTEKELEILGSKMRQFKNKSKKK